MENPLDKAKTLAGTAGALAERYKVSPQAISQWKFIPETRALETEQLFGGEITAREVLEYAAEHRAAA